MNLGEKKCSDDLSGVEECMASIDGCSYWTSVESCGDTATCSDTVEPVQCVPNVVYVPVRDIVQDSTNGSSTKKDVFKGNEFLCNHNATVQNFEIYLDPSRDIGDTAITFAIYEKDGSNWTKIFDTQITTPNDNIGETFFSTGTISVELLNGKSYAFGAMFNRDCKYFYRNVTGQAVNFGSQIRMISKERINGLPATLDNVDGYTIKMAITSQLK